MTIFLTVGALAQSTAPGAPPPAVIVAPVEEREVSQQDDFTGRIQAIQSVDIQPRVEGYLETVNFAEGSDVEKGDLLFQIDKRPYEASLAQAQAQLASANGTVAKSQAALNNSEVILARQQTLLQRDTVSQAVVDDATTQRDEAAADLQSAQAQVEEAKANVQSAQLNLSYTTIVSPIDGRIGPAIVTAGNLVSSASGTMATVVQLDPIRVAFSVPDILYTNLVQQAGEVHAGRAKELFSPQLQLPNGKIYDQEGEIAFSGNVIDQSTGTITVYADFPNPSSVLLPGSFVVVTVQESAKTRRPVIGASAVIQDKDGAYVFVVDNDDTAQVRRITIASRSNNDVVVSDGLSQGETVIVQGVQKVRPGQKVTPTTAQTAAATSTTAQTGQTAPTQQN